ncbi:hypothetical protein ASPACDRAFT_1879572, partial [Aspergillus aculeatus ATCC 16872]
MDGLSSAASVIAVIQLTGSLVRICAGYVQEVKNARNEIFSLQEAIKIYLHSRDGKALPTSSHLAKTITECLSDLRSLEAKIDPRSAGNLMRKFGLRALKWPLKRTEVNNMTQSLERYKSSFLLCLQVDQTSLMVGVAQTSYHLNEDMVLTKLKSATEASFESFSNRNEAHCLHGTRTELLQQILDWALLSSHGRSIFWLKGMAGTGKSTISRTVAMSLKDSNHLGASFFFKRGEGDRELKDEVQKAIHNDPDIATKSIREQFDKLLLQPLLSLDQLSRQPQFIVMVIDALDECEHDRDIRTIIGLLPLLKKSKMLPMSLGFSEIARHEYQDLALHDIPEAVTERDIRLFLRHRFTKIRKDRSIPDGWPGDDVIHDIVMLSVPLFIAAATNDELEQQQLLEEFHKIVGIIILLATPLSTKALSAFIGWEVERIRHRLKFFRSVLSVPDNQDLAIRILHLSFRDFLVQSGSKFHVDEDICNLQCPGMLRVDIDPAHILQCLPPELRYSCRYWIHHIEKSNDISSMTGEVQIFLQELFLQWVESMALLGLISEVVIMLDLLHRIVTVSDDAAVLSDFVYDAKRFVLKFCQIADEAPLQIYFSGLVFAPERSMIRRRYESELPDWITQLPRVEEGWSPELRIIEGHKRKVSSVSFSPDGRLIASGSDDWSVCLWETATGMLQQTLMGHSSGVTSVDFSPNDGLLLVSGSSDDTVRVWETATAFSPNGQLLASGSYDKTVRLWDTATGMLLQTLEGHLDWVSSVAFSPDSQLIASSSQDKTVRLWSIATGVVQHTLKGHSGSINCVAFSSDGLILASGSEDFTLRLWNAETGVLQQTLEAHSIWNRDINSIAFSPDDRLLAAGCRDSAVRVWDR